jgi:biopolymer transport protein ExbB
MKSLAELIHEGGPVMFAIMALSVVLYSRCFQLVVSLRRSRRRLHEMERLAPDNLAPLRRLQDEVQEGFRQQRVALGAMIAAAPLLGLLGTVSGLIRTFDSLSRHAGQKSMEELAGGISQVLVATESGLAVAIPALLIVYLAHREMRKYLQNLNRLEQHVHQEAAS